MTTHLQVNLAKFYSRLNAFRVDGTFTDVTIQCADGGDSFQCHRLVLAIASDYFKDMLRNTFKERTTDSIILREVSTATFQEVLRFVYTGDAKIDRDNFQDVIRASEFFLLSGLRDSCISFMKQNMDKFTVQNLLNTYLYTRVNKEYVLTSIVRPQLADKLEMFYRADEFLELPFGALSEIIKHRSDTSTQMNMLMNGVALAATMRWVRHEGRVRSLDAHVLFRNIVPMLRELLATNVFQSDNATPRRTLFAILCSISIRDNFKVMSMNSFEERYSDNIVLPGMRTKTVREMRFIYTDNARIDCDNFLDLFRASKLFHHSGLRDSSISFVKKERNMDKFTMHDLLSMYSYARENRKNALVNTLHSHLGRRFEMLHGAEEFLELPLDILSANSDKAALKAKTRWARPASWKRLQHVAGQVEDEEPIVKKPKTVYSATPHRSKSSFGHVPVVTDFNASTKDLHVYVTFPEEDVIQIYSINGFTGNVRRLPRVVVNNPSDQFRTVVAGYDAMLYRLLYYGIEAPNAIVPNFTAYTSAEMRTAQTLKTPPIYFRNAILCAIQNIIYAYHVPRPNVLFRTAPITFTDKEIDRGLFAYNCEVDEWFLLPKMKKRARWAGMTVLNKNLYMIGGDSHIAGGFSRKYVQAYDSRHGKWRSLPRTRRNYYRASACCMHSKIYAFGGCNRNVCERYDPVAGRWETLTLVQYSSALTSKLIAYQHKIWSFDTDPFLPIPYYTTKQLHFQTGTDQMDAQLGPRTFTWTEESIEMTKNNEVLTRCVDSVAYKRIV